jgi:hypothetical protein
VTDRVREALERPPTSLSTALDQLAHAPTDGLDLTAVATMGDAAGAVLVGVGGERAGAAAGVGATKKTGAWAAVKAWLRW